MSSKLFDLSGRTGLVTGSARGLVGREAARRMIKRGLGSASEILQRLWKFSKCQTIAIEEDRL